MTKSILIPLDGSPFGARALPLAIRIARSAAATLALVHVHDRSVQLTGAPATDLRFDGEMEQLMKRELEQTADRLRADTRLPVNVTFIEGPVSDALLQHIAETRPWLVVMNSHGRGGLRRMMLGSVADALARQSGVPILIEHCSGDASPSEPAANEPTFRNVLLSLDGSPLADDIVVYAMQLGEAGRTMFTLLRVVVPSPMVVEPAPVLPPMIADEIKRREREALAQIERVAFTLKQHGFLTMPQIIVHPQPAAGILAFAAEHPTDLIALSTHGYGGFARATLGSVADRVMRGANVAVLLHASSRDDR